MKNEMTISRLVISLILVINPAIVIAKEINYKQIEARIQTQQEHKIIVGNKKTKSQMGSTVAKVGTAGLIGVGSMALFGLWAANEWNCAAKPSRCR